MTFAILLKYRREIGIGLIALVLISACIYVRSVFAERDRLLHDNSLLNEKLKSAASMQALTDKISVAISQIKIRSQVNVSRIESEPKPVFTDSRPLAFIPGGMLQAVYSSAVIGGAPPGPASGGSLPPGKPPGGVLPR
jgi:hypothetical protein